MNKPLIALLFTAACSLALSGCDPATEQPDMTATAVSRNGWLASALAPVPTLACPSAVERLDPSPSTPSPQVIDTPSESLATPFARKTKALRSLKPRVASPGATEADLADLTRGNTAFAFDLYPPPSRREYNVEAPARVELATESVHKVDGVRPTLVAASAVGNGNTLTLTWDKALDEDSVPSTSSGAFSVSVGGVRCGITGVLVIGRVVTLTLTSAVTTGDTITVSYVVPHPIYDPLRDTVGNYAGNNSVVVPIKSKQVANAAPAFPTSEDGTRSVDENTAAGDNIGAPVAATDPNSGDTLIYGLSGADASAFEIVESSGQLRTKTALNYEAKSSYSVTVSVRDGKDANGAIDAATDDTVDMTINVSNVDEAGTVSFSEFGAAIRARLSDPDGGVDGVTWQWARSSDRRTGWTNIGSATLRRYTPSGDDQGMYLRATASYADAQGSGKGAQGVSANQISPPDLQVATLVSGLSIPWDIAFTPDGTMLFTQRVGVLSSRLSDGTVKTVTADFGDLVARGETGLMGIVVDPNFASNRRFYTCQGHTGPEVQVIAWTINSTYTEATRVTDPLVGGIPATNGRHGGCRLRFGPEGYLWIATGDAATGTVPQDLTSLGGKVLRVNASTGAGAPTNPFASSPLVYTYGHRNVQGLALRPGTSQMWAVEHGPSVDDEVNLLAENGNYGWNPVPGYNEEVPMTDLAEYPSAIEAKWSSGSPTLAASGAIFLEGDQWGIWEGRLAVATLKDQKLRIFEFDRDGAFVSQVVLTELDGTFGRLRTPMLGPDGALYVSTSNGGGADRILRITVNTPPTGAPAITGVAEVGEELTANTSGIADADGLNDVSYVYQWVRVASGGVETDIPLATLATYRVIADDVGAALKVKATFTDDKGNPESAESALTAVVTVAQVVATFGAGPYAAEEGRSARVRVSLDKNPHRTVTIPLIAAPLEGADPGDYAVPTEVVFNAG